MKPFLEEFYKDQGWGIPELSNEYMKDLAYASFAEICEEAGELTFKNAPHDLYSTKKLAGIIKAYVREAFNEKRGIDWGILAPLTEVIFSDYNLRQHYSENDKKPIKDMRTIDEMALEAHLLAMELDSVEKLPKERLDVLKDFVNKMFYRYMNASSEDMKPRYAA